MMLYLMELIDSVRGFMSTGGDVLYVVMFVLFVMWVLMIERYWFFVSVYPGIRKDVIARWDARQDTTSWYAHKIRDAWLSQASDLIDERMMLIRSLVALCPMVGLLGTVTGMITVFEVMAMQGTGNARSMAAGISMATVPTMAGMVAALSGVFFSSRLDARAKVLKESLRDSMPHH